ncbi:MAG: hypothetical protein PHQ20_03010 [Candidatus Moranbacteria bacterium]|jgi:hypothetical protein|nr:hypothetical protein [Candidatus Moranbacteria bacterium]
MRKIGSQSFYNHQAFSKKTKEQNKKIKELFKKDNLAEETNDRRVSENELRFYQTENKRQDVLIFWQAKEYEKKNRHQIWYFYFYLILFGLVLYAFLTNNLLMSIIFILFGFLFYFYEKREPKEYTFGITKEGIFAQNRLYEFSALENFWIFYQPGGIKELSLKSQKPFLPYINIPLGSTDPIKIRKLLLNHLPEKQHERGLSDIIEKIL